MINRKSKNELGFTLVEVLVVSAIIVFMTGLFIRNFNADRLYLNEAANIILADIRRVQQNALSGLQYTDPASGVKTIRCGYGIERVSNFIYRFYVGPESVEPNGYCTPGTTGGKVFGNTNFNTSGALHTRDIELSQKDFQDQEDFLYPNLEFKSNFSDIFFLPPDPKIWVNNNPNLNAPPSVITIGPLGSSCSGSNCRTICVYTSGSMYIKVGNDCP